jgi:protein TonB
VTASSVDPEAESSFLDPVLSLGRRQVRVGIAIGLAGALSVHGAFAGRAAIALPELSDFVRSVKEVLEGRLSATIDVDLPKPPPPPPPPPAPEPEPEPKTPPPESNAPPPPPPALAEAAKVLTQDPDPDEPLDFTDNTFVSGTGERYAGGITASAGTSKQAVYHPSAQLGGVPGGTGEKPAPPAPPPKDLSQLAKPVGASFRDCGFPAEADLEQINHMLVNVVAVVAPDGRAQSVSVLSDPGYGFGQLARSCALRGRYAPGLNRAGQPASTTVRFVIKFKR